MQAPESDIADRIQAPLLRRLYAYWSERRGARPFPARGDLDPLAFKFVLGQVMLIDVLYEPLRFRFRLHGTTLALRSGYDMTGKMVDELPGPENRAVLVDRCRFMVATRKPHAVRSERVADGRMARYEALWLPLSDDGETINMLMGGLIYLDP